MYLCSFNLIVYPHYSLRNRQSLGIKYLTGFEQNQVNANLIVQTLDRYLHCTLVSLSSTYIGTRDIAYIIHPKVCLNISGSITP